MAYIQQVKGTQVCGRNSITTASKLVKRSCAPAVGQVQKTQLAPQFTLASADEQKTKSAANVAKLTDVPAWRVVLGNVAAGATAGCAVEAGNLCLQQS